MFKMIFFILLFLAISYLLSPYLTSLFSYFGVGKNLFTDYLTFITQFINTTFNVLSQQTYFMTFLSVLVFISLIFMFINHFGGMADE